MHQLVSAAERLREVRRARDQFLTLWELMTIEAHPAAVERLTRAIEAATAVREADPFNHDWRFLSRGRFMDD